MSSNKKQQKLQPTNKVEEKPKVPLCDFCHQPGLALKACAGCGCEKYCDSTCQKARWPHHKAECKAKRQERESEAKTKETVKERGSGSGLRDMGSIMAALIQQPLQPQQRRYNEVDAYNAVIYDHHTELKKMLQQSGLDIDWTEPVTGSTATFAAAQFGYDKCLKLLISHGADIAKADKAGWAPIHTACQSDRYACLELLADNGADLNQVTTADRLPAACIAAQNGSDNCLALLI